MFQVLARKLGAAHAASSFGSRGKSQAVVIQRGDEAETVTLNEEAAN